MAELKIKAVRLKEYSDYKDVSIRSMERELKLSNGSINNAAKRDGDVYVETSTLTEKYPDVNIDWLESGEGKMLLAQSRTEEPVNTYIKKNLDVYFVPVPATAGFLSTISDHQVRKEDLIKVVLPPDYTGVDFVFEIDGDSMYPTFTNGDHVGCRHITTLKYFRYGEPYLLDIGDGGILLKRVFKHESNPSLLVLRSDNILYQDIDIERADIISAFLVTTKLSKNVGRSSLDLKN